MKKVSLFIILLVAINVTASYATIRLPKLISNGMILQRNKPIHIWGWANATEKLTIRFNKKVYTTIADADGNWSCLLPAMPAGGPYSMQLNELTITDILLGDVWICSGQSNMELPMDRVALRYPRYIAECNYPQIRQFLVPDAYNFLQPQTDLSGGSWQPAQPAFIRNFTAAGYFFAVSIYNKYKIPIGLINTALGGSPAESWISEDSIAKFPGYYQETQRFKNQQLIDSIETTEQHIANNWYHTLNEKDPGVAGNWADQWPTQDNSIQIPGYWRNGPLQSLIGSAWFERKFVLPNAVAGQPAFLELGRIVDADSVFINGQFAGTTSYQYPPRRYHVPSGLLHAGENTIIVRVICTAGNGGFVPGKPYRISFVNDTIDLQGKWEYALGGTMPPLPGQTFIRWKPVGLYNSMIAPLTPYAVSGFLWYQGESNASHPNDYLELMKTLVRNWRTAWHDASLPFLYVQLPNFMDPRPTPQESNWALLREQQLRLLALPYTGMAVAIDVGEANDIHPENKKVIGERLAKQAMEWRYGNKKIIANGPAPLKIQRAAKKLVIAFANAPGGLITKDGKPPAAFAICGQDGIFKWAKTKINGSTIEVWNDEIPEPIEVRYAWADNPDNANLYNKMQLPASPFRLLIPQEK